MYLSGYGNLIVFELLPALLKTKKLLLKLLLKNLFYTHLDLDSGL